MTIQAQISAQAQIFIPRDYQVFAGLDVDKHSIAVTFCNQEGSLRSLRWARLCTRSHNSGSKWVTVNVAD